MKFNKFFWVIVMFILSMNMAFSISYTENVTFYPDHSGNVYQVNRTIEPHYTVVTGTTLQMNNQTFNYTDYGLDSNNNVTDNLYFYWDFNQDLNDTIKLNVNNYTLEGNNSWGSTTGGWDGEGFQNANNSKGNLLITYTPSLGYWYPDLLFNQTFSMWFYPNSTNNTLFAIEKKPGPSDAEMFIISNDSGVYASYGGQPYCYQTTNDIKTLLSYDMTNSSTFTNKWHSLTVSFNGVGNSFGNIYFYLDGDLVGSKTGSDDCYFNGGDYLPKFGGCDNAYCVDSLTGKIDDVRYYNETLTAGQIYTLGRSKNNTRAIYNVSVNIKRADTLALFPGNVSFNATNSYSLIDEYASAGTKQLILTDDTYNYTVSSTDFTTVTGSFDITYLNQSVNIYVNPTAQIDNCTTYTQRVINFTLIDEDTNEYITGNASGYFEILPPGYTTPVAYNATWTNVNNFSLCVRDILTNYSLDGQMEYGASGYIDELYYYDDTYLYNTTLITPLYLSTGVNNVSFRVLDENHDPVEGVIISILEYDLTTNSAIITEKIKTGSNGYAIGKVVLNDKRYKFILSVGDKIYLETADTILTLTDHIFRINLGGDYFTNYDIKMGVSCDLTYSNITKIFEFTFNDPNESITKGCLKVSRVLSTGEILYIDECLTATGGVISGNISNLTLSNSYLAQGFFYIGTDSYPCAESSYNFNPTYKIFDQMGIFFTLFLVMVLIVIGMFSPTASIIMALLGVLVPILLGIFYLDWYYYAALVVYAGFTLWVLKGK